MEHIRMLFQERVKQSAYHSETFKCLTSVSMTLVSSTSNGLPYTPRAFPGLPQGSPAAHHAERLPDRRSRRAGRFARGRFLC